MTRSGSHTPLQHADAIATYREMLRAIPGLGAMYRLVQAIIDSRFGDGSRMMIVGAGGGRELAELGHSDLALDVLAIDPSERNLEWARGVADSIHMPSRVAFVQGRVEDLCRQKPFDIATSLLVMHHIPHDGSKRAYLTALASHLTDDGIQIHADICIDGQEELERLMPAYRAHARLAGIHPDIIAIEVDAIPKLSIVSLNETRVLFAEAGFEAPQEIFRSLWYRCWVARRGDTSTKSSRERA